MVVKFIVVVEWDLGFERRVIGLSLKATVVERESPAGDIRKGSFHLHSYYFLLRTWLASLLVPHNVPCRGVEQQMRKTCLGRPQGADGRLFMRKDRKYVVR